MNDQKPIFINTQKQRVGISRMWHALNYSIAGLKVAWGETAFKQEAFAAMLLTPLAFYIGTHWVETALLVGSVLLVCITELLNTAIEVAIDRIGPERHELSRQAKDIGSAAVLLSLLLCGTVWIVAIWTRFV